MTKQRPKELDYFHRKQAQYFAYYRVPKLLFTHDYYRNITTEAKILYGILLDRMQLSLRNRWFDEEGRVYVYYTIQEIMERLGCGNQKAVSLLKELDVEHGIGLVEKKRQGRGKPNALYIKNFASILSENKDIFLCPEECDNHILSDVKNTPLEMWKSHANKTDKNKTEFSETDLSYRGDQKARAPCKDVISFVKNQTSYDYLVHDFPKDQGLIDELIGLIADIIQTPDQATVKIAGVEKPLPVVKSQFMKLQMFHIQYVLECLKKSTTNVSNIKSYLLTTLYNAPMTMENYYRSRVQYEMYGNPAVKEEDRHGVPP